MEPRTARILPVCVLAAASSCSSLLLSPLTPKRGSGPWSMAIGEGAFHKIGSVLVALDGQLFSEPCHDGSAASLRDTLRNQVDRSHPGLHGHRRSPDRRRVFARALFFPVRSMQNPDPRKAAMTLEGLLTMSPPLAV